MNYFPSSLFEQSGVTTQTKSNVPDSSDAIELRLRYINYFPSSLFEKSLGNYSN